MTAALSSCVELSCVQIVCSAKFSLLSWHIAIVNQPSHSRHRQFVVCWRFSAFSWKVRRSCS